MEGGKGWAAPAEGKGVDAETGKEMKARQMQTIQFGLSGFGFSFGHQQPTREGCCCTQHGSSTSPPTALGGCMCPLPTLESSFFGRGGGGREQGAGEDLSWERCDMVKPSPAPKGCAPGTPPARRASHPISSQHHLLPPAFLGRFAHRGPVRLSISLFGARMNIY